MAIGPLLKKPMVTFKEKQPRVEELADTGDTGMAEFNDTGMAEFNDCEFNDCTIDSSPSGAAAVSLRAEIDHLKREVATLKKHQLARDDVEQGRAGSQVYYGVPGRRGLEFYQTAAEQLKILMEFRENAIPVLREAQNLAFKFRGGVLQHLQARLVALEVEGSADKALKRMREVFERKAARKAARDGHLLAQLNGDHQGETVMQWAERCGVSQSSHR